MFLSGTIRDCKHRVIATDNQYCNPQPEINRPSVQTFRRGGNSLGVIMHNAFSSKIAPLIAILGTVLLLIGTSLHPMDADPNTPVAAFSEYAADPHWVASHLLQLFGVVLMVVALVLFSRRLEDGPAAAWILIVRIGAAVSLALAAALQAVDGVALKVMVQSWAAAAEPERTSLFHATFAVRQIEIGLASMSSLLFGLTVVAYGIALLIDHQFPRWLGVLALVSGVPTAIAGIVIAYTGFSDLAMLINMPASLLLMMWVITLGIHAWKRPAGSA